MVSSLINLNKNDLERGDVIYCTLIKNEEAYVIQGISKQEPAEGIVFIKTKVKYIYEDVLKIETPFNRYYTQDDVAKKIEDLVREGEYEVHLGVSISEEGEVYPKQLYIDGWKAEDFVKKIED